MAQPAEDRARLTFDRAAAWSLLTEFTRGEGACALVRPGRLVTALTAASVTKKLRDRACARAVSRDDVYRGAELDVDLDAHIAFVVDALAPVAPEIGLARA